MVGQDPKFHAFCRALNNNQEPAKHVKAWIFTDQPTAIARRLKSSCMAMYFLKRLLWSLI